MAIQIGKYKRPGIFIEEIDKSIITSPTVEGISNLVIGFSRKGPVNTAVQLKTVGDLERIFGSLDRQLERKGSFFHRTISKMLESSPVYAVNLLLSDDTLDTIEYQSISAAPQYINDVERTDSYRKFFDTTGFWKRDTDSFIDLTKENDGYESRVINLTNLSDRYITVFCFKSQRTGFDRAMLEWYGSIEKLPTYVYPTDLASDYLVDVVVVGGDWSSYQELSVDPRWSRYFSSEGLRKSMVREFASDRNVTQLAFYEGLSLIPYFRDLNGVNIFIETVINRDTDKTGLFCAFNADLFETDYPKGIVDLIGNSLVGDELMSNPPNNDETYYQSLDKNDGIVNGDLDINFLSYKEVLTETIPFTNRVLDRAGNVVALFGASSSLKLQTFSHSYNDSINVKGGVVSGPNSDVNLNIVAYPNRTYWFSEGYVNDLGRGTITSTTQSITVNYVVDASSRNGYGVIGGNVVSFTGTSSVQISPSSYPTISATTSYNVAYVLDTQGSIKAVQTTVANTKPKVAASDIVLGWGTVSVVNGAFATSSSISTANFKDVTVGTVGSGSNPFKNFVLGTDYTVATSSVSGQMTFTLLNTNSSPDETNYEQYRKFKLFNSMLSYFDSSSKSQGLMLLNPQTTTTKKSLETVTFTDIVTSTARNKAFTINTGLGYADVANIASNGELVLYKLDDEFLIDYAGFETKNTLPILNGSTASFGVVGKYSNFYSRYNQGLISTGDVFYQNPLFSSVEATFLPGEGVTSSLAGYNYLVFKVNATATYYSRVNSYFNKVQDYLGDGLTPGYQFWIGGSQNSGVFSTIIDGGLDSSNQDLLVNYPSLTLPSDPSGIGPSGRAYMLATFSGGTINTINTASYSYYAYEISESIVSEVTTISKLFAYNSDFNDRPIYLQMYLDDSDNLKVRFMDHKLSTGGTPSQVVISSIVGASNVFNSLSSNTTLYVKSEKSNFKQSLEAEFPTGWADVPNKILVKRDRYSEVKVGDYLEAQYDASTLRPDQMPKKLTRILTKKLWSVNQSYMELSCDSAIKFYNFNGDKQTIRRTKIDDYVSTYKAISLKGFRIREASLPDGTEEKQTQILDVVANGTNLFKALTNKEAFDFRYLIDSFGLGLTEDSKQQLVDICGSRLDSFGILNMPSLKQFKNSVSPSFKDSTGTLQCEYIGLGGNPESNPDFLYSFGKGPGTTAVGYFLPYVTVDDYGRSADVPPASYVGSTYMRKFNSTISSIVPWTIAAGVNDGKILGIKDLETIFTPSDIEFLNQAQMNPLTFKRNRGFIIETENTAQVLVKSALSYIHVREVLIELERELSRMLLGFQWKFNTPEVRSQIKLQSDVICEKYVAQAGLYNYFNKIDDENNTSEIIDNQIGVLDTYVEVIKGMGIIVNNITILRTGAIQAGGFINS